MAQKITISLEDDEQLERISEALYTKTRRNILRLCTEKPYSISELAQCLKTSVPNICFHCKSLQKAGLIYLNKNPGKKGNEKVVSVCFHTIQISAKQSSSVRSTKSHSLSLPIGSYTDFHVQAPCGLIFSDGSHAELDRPLAFYHPLRHRAQLLYFSKGYVEYTVPFHIAKRTISSLSFSLEVCAEAPFYNENWLSDITFWINGVECCTYTCKGDYGKRRGILTPDLWGANSTQYGYLQKVSVTSEGTFLNETCVSPVTIADLNISDGSFKLRIGIKDDAKNAGGINIFGEKFGDHPQNIQVTVSTVSL